MRSLTMKILDPDRSNNFVYQEKCGQAATLDSLCVISRSSVSTLGLG